MLVNNCVKKNTATHTHTQHTTQHTYYTPHHTHTNTHHTHTPHTHTHTHTHCHINTRTHLCTESELCIIFHPGILTLFKVGGIFFKGFFKIGSFTSD